MSEQTTDTVLMIEPAAFGYNEQTAVNNHFQHIGDTSASETQRLALSEFRGAVEKLRNNGVRVVVVRDTPDPHTPDSIFPNNWISFHDDGKVVLYPMFAENRRLERRPDVVKQVENAGFAIGKTVDYSYFERQSLFLEGTGSMVLDRVNRIAYAALSERTAPEVLQQFCSDNRYTPVVFSAFQTTEHARRAIYHTNVMLCLADGFAVVCLQAIDDELERQALTDSLLATHKDIVEITEAQMHSFAGNMLQIRSIDGCRFLAMSETAYASLTAEQLHRFERHCNILTFFVPTIETTGGGGIRCMMAEIFLPKTEKLVL
jgi:hypothetical protein